MNQTVITGRLTTDPDVRIAGGTTVATFSLANNDKKNKTFFIDCAAFGKTAEILDKYARKGKQIAVCGTIAWDEYTDKEGNSRKTLKLAVEKVTLLGSNNE